MYSNNKNKRMPLHKGFASTSDDRGGLSAIIAASRTTGTLNLSNRQLKEVPRDALETPTNDDSVRWWEVVDLTKLDLSHNEVEGLTEQLWSLGALATLLLSNNKLKQLPAGISSLQSLKLLDLSDNPLGPTLPEDLAQLPSLASLQCNNCCLTTLPDALGGPQQPKLSLLSACGNQLRSVPQLLLGKSLVVLKLGNNQLEQLSGQQVLQWTALKELDVSHNQLQALPNELGELSNLARLDVRNNQLTALAESISTACGLLELMAGFNRLTALPTNIGLLTSLKTLDVRNNTIQELPDTLCRLQLVLLDLTNNCLRRLPPALGTMTSLRSMPLDGNPLKLMRREIWSGPISGLLQHLRDQMQPGDSRVSPLTSPRPADGLDSSPSSRSLARACVAGGEASLQGTGLTSVPVDVWEAAATVSKLDLSDNHFSQGLTSLSEGLAGCSNLRVLCLNNCSLRSWPLSGLQPGCLDGLHTLEACGNAFGQLPVNGLAACAGLRSLDLSGVMGLQLPAGFFSATPHLEVLALSRAGLSELPPAVLTCCSLTQLLLPNNSLSCLPVEITQLTRLQELDVTNNHVSKLPPEMGLMAPQLRVLRLEGNCIRVIRRAVLDKGTAAVLEWLKDRIPL